MPIRARLLFAFATAFALGCSPSIGDKCSLSTDCSLSGDRVCDTAQPDGYCTILECAPNACPDNAACVMFHPSVPGCPIDDRQSARTAHSYCMASCTSDSDCRDGYRCRDPRGLPWDAVIVDDNQGERVCIVAENGERTGAAPPNEVPPVCQSGGAPAPPIPVPRSDAGPNDAGATDAASPNDAGDASDGGAADAALDGGTTDA